MRLPTSRIRAASLLIFLMAVGLSMVAGPCYPDDAGTVVPQTLPPYVTNTPPPTIPPTATTVPNPTPTPVPTEGPSAAVEETEAPGEHEGEVSAAEAMAAAETVAPIVERTPRDVSGSLFFSPLAGGASDFRAESPTVEELLELGWFKSGASPVHIALRAAPETHSVRCEWHGIARTPAQRGKQLRFLLGSLLSDDQVLPSAVDLETLLTALTSEVALGWKEKLQASYIPLATGRMNTEHRTLYCYADFVPREYLLGSGPAKVTVAYDLRQQEFSHSVYQRIYDTYQAEFEAEGITRDQVLTREGYNAEYLDQPVRDAESLLKESIAGRDSVLFLAPMGVYDNIAVEVWQAVAQWDLQDDAGVLQAVRHGVDECHPEFSQTLANLTSRITTAAGSDAFADQRVANVSELTQLYQDIGAYRDISPDDGSSNVFTPAAPLPVQVCTGSTSVGTTANFPLTRDCSILLDLKDTLAGTASLNWSKDTAINSWTGVTVSGTPQRVTGLALASGNLNGTIPAGLGRLHGLTSLDLSGNALTGSIPAVLGDLPGLATLRMSGNSLSGCIPVALRDLETNDLATLGISFCDMLTPPTLSE